MSLSRYQSLPSKAFLPAAGELGEEKQDNSPEVTQLYGNTAQTCVYDTSSPDFNFQVIALGNNLRQLCRTLGFTQAEQAAVRVFFDRFSGQQLHQSMEYYANLKYWFEKLFLALSHPNSHLLPKQQILHDLLEAIQACPPSVNTRIQQILMSFWGSQSPEISQWLAQLRTELIAQVSQSFCRGNNISVPMEIHEYKHFLKHARNLGWNPVIMEDIPDFYACSAEAADDIWFEQEFLSLYNQECIMEHIANRLINAIVQRIEEKNRVNNQRGVSFCEVSVLGDIASILEGLPIVDQVVAWQDVLFDSVQTENVVSRPGFRFEGTNYYLLLKNQRNLIYSLVPYFYTYLVSENSTWYRTFDTILSPADVAGFRFLIIPYAPKLCYVIRPDGRWRHLMKCRECISPVSDEEALEWELNQPPVSWQVYQTYRQAGRDNFEGVTFALIDLRQHPDALKILNDKQYTGTKRIDVIQLCHFYKQYCPDKWETGSWPAFEDFLTHTMNTMTVDTLHLPACADEWEQRYCSLYFFSELKRWQPNGLMAQFVWESLQPMGFDFPNIMITGFDPQFSDAFPPWDMVYLALAHVLRLGNYPKNLKVYLDVYPVTPAQLNFLVEALERGPCQVGLSLTLKLEGDIVSHVSSLARAITSSNCPQGLRLDFSPTLGLNTDCVAALAHALLTGKCPKGLALNFAAVRCIDEAGLRALVVALASGRCPEGLALCLPHQPCVSFHLWADALTSGQCPRGLSLDLSHAVTWESPEAIESLLNTLSSGHCPRDLKLNLSDTGLTASHLFQLIILLENRSYPQGLSIVLDNRVDAQCRDRIQTIFDYHQRGELPPPWRYVPSELSPIDFGALEAESEGEVSMSVEAEESDHGESVDFDLAASFSPQRH